MSSERLEVICPCCEAKLQVDKKSGEVIWKEEKPKPEVSLSDMVKDLDHQARQQESMFKKQSENLKDRGRILDEKFKEASKHVDKSGDRPLRDFDLD